MNYVDVRGIAVDQISSFWSGVEANDSLSPAKENAKVPIIWLILFLCLVIFQQIAELANKF